ncbi:hypothetical protein H4582DRAFT_2054127 [Lactarius indigo]|nr:hypothetical protein H4582DRAFT_2054127 [Lactarius indigo]
MGLEGGNGGGQQIPPSCKVLATRRPFEANPQARRGGIKCSHQGNQTKSRGYPMRGGVREEGDIALDTVDTKEIGRWGGRTWEKGYDFTPCTDNVYSSKCPNAAANMPFEYLRSIAQVAWDWVRTVAIEPVGGWMRRMGLRTEVAVSARIRILSGAEAIVNLARVRAKAVFSQQICDIVCTLGRMCEAVKRVIRRVTSLVFAVRPSRVRRLNRSQPKDKDGNLEFAYTTPAQSNSNHPDTTSFSSKKVSSRAGNYSVASGKRRCFFFFWQTREWEEDGGDEVFLQKIPAKVALG